MTHTDQTPTPLAIRALNLAHEVGAEAALDRLGDFIRTCALTVELGEADEAREAVEAWDERRADEALVEAVRAASTSELVEAVRAELRAQRAAELAEASAFVSGCVRFAEANGATAALDKLGTIADRLPEAFTLGELEAARAGIESSGEAARIDYQAERAAELAELEAAASPDEARELVERLTADRRAAAERILNLRRLVRVTVGTPTDEVRAELRRITRAMAAEAESKPTRAYLEAYEVDCRAFAAQPIPEGLYCGDDDAFGERQDAALALARSIGALLRAWEADGR